MSLLTSAVSMTKAMVQIDSTDPGTYEKKPWPTGLSSNYLIYLMF